MHEPTLSPLIRFGTSPWTYEGWQGQVYKKTYTKSRFKQDCLAEYADFEYTGQRLFRTVGIDHTFYGPPTPKMLAHYAEQVPPGFQVCAKVWEEAGRSFHSLVYDAAPPDASRHQISRCGEGLPPV
jgi:uncharacterized protein YecE (DUF72 family)